MDATDLVRDFWARMARNDFASVAPLLAPDFELTWPQTRERIVGAEHFVQMNTEYPARGPWRFALRRLVGDARQVVTEVAITDGAQAALALSFFTVEDGRITRLTEYWPEPYDPPPGRAHLVEPMEHAWP